MQLGLGHQAVAVVGVLARCQSEAPMALQVVSMPAISSRAMVPPTWLGLERLAVDLGLQQVAR